MKKLFALLVFGLLVGCSSKPETPLAGDYSSRVGQLSFPTTATANLTLMGGAAFSGDVREANWKRKGDVLTIETRPNFKNQYQITYSFDIVDDGAQLILKRVDTKTEATGNVETTELPEGTKADLTFNKHNS